VAELVYHAFLTQDPPGEDEHERADHEDIVGDKGGGTRDGVEDKNRRQINEIDSDTERQREEKTVRYQAERGDDEQIETCIVGGDMPAELQDHYFNDERRKQRRNGNERVLIADAPFSLIQIKNGQQQAGYGESVTGEAFQVFRGHKIIRDPYEGEKDDAEQQHFADPVLKPDGDLLVEILFLGHILLY
jgi:hypothetical protein